MRHFHQCPAQSADTAIWNLFEQYFDRYRERFDLFDERAPFYQVAGLHTTKNEFAGRSFVMGRSQIGESSDQFTSGSLVPNTSRPTYWNISVFHRLNEGSRLFSIRGVQSLKHMSAAEAARWLVSTQAFDPTVAVTEEYSRHHLTIVLEHSIGLNKCMSRINRYDFTPTGLSMATMTPSSTPPHHRVGTRCGGIAM